MSIVNRRTIGILAAFCLLVIVAGALSLQWLRRPRLTPELRGYEHARRLGCFGCHGPDGTGGTPNLGSDEETVPAWDGGNVMMYVENEGEIREWILFGRPRRLQDHGEPRHSHDEDENPLLDMPAFSDVISEGELQELISYYKVVAAFDPIPPEVRPGHEVASRSGCYGCHGPRGLIGTSNPGSFKGYIPPWRGPDFEDLVHDEAELRQWIAEGRIDRLEENPVARFFTSRQIIQMPAYEDRLTEEELSNLVAYIQWLQEENKGLEP